MVRMLLAELQASSWSASGCVRVSILVHFLYALIEPSESTSPSPSRVHSCARFLAHPAAVFDTDTRAFSLFASYFYYRQEIGYVYRSTKSYKVFLLGLVKQDMGGGRVVCKRLAARVTVAQRTGRIEQERKGREGWKHTRADEDTTLDRH